MMKIKLIDFEDLLRQHEGANDGKVTNSLKLCDNLMDTSQNMMDVLDMIFDSGKTLQINIIRGKIIFLGSDGIFRSVVKEDGRLYYGEDVKEEDEVNNSDFIN